MPISPSKLKTLKWTIDKAGMTLKPVVLKATEDEMRNRVRKNKNETVNSLTHEIRDMDYLKQMARIGLNITDFEALAQKVLNELNPTARTKSFEPAIQNIKMESLKETKTCQETNTMSSQPTQKNKTGTTLPLWKRLLRLGKTEPKQKDS